MLWINFKRVLKSGFFSFWRNGFVSLSSVFVMIVALSVLLSIIFMNAIFTSSLDALQKKVDVNIYFNPNATEADILSLKERLEFLPEVSEVTYVSRQQALLNFQERHRDDATTLQALEELDDNPLGAALNIRTVETSQYESVANFLTGNNILGSDGGEIVDRFNYNQNKTTIDRLTSIINSTERIGLVTMAVLILLAILVTFNTIRLAIYVAREEISVMKLVGASPMYIRGPFMIEGTLYGVIAGVITLIIFYPVAAWVGSETSNFFIGMNLFDYYVNNFLEIFVIIIGAGILIGAVSSYLAVRRYLK